MNDEKATEDFVFRKRDKSFREVLKDKFLKSFLESSRFWSAVAGIMVSLLSPYLLGFDQDLALGITSLISAWIAGETVRPADNVLLSRRFWAMVLGSVAAIAGRYGIQIDTTQLIGLVMTIVAWIGGDTKRETKSGQEKKDQELFLRHK